MTSIPNPSLAATIRAIAEDPRLMEIGRRAVEDELIEWRDARRFTLRANGYCVRESDGQSSDIVRFGPEFGCRIALESIASAIEAEA